ncbi:hypothetical protein, partial [Haemophilus parainfluenzae]|uniref:hypothetical protein n=1 Tax=Haemophilus parainfluenzae TaxID=729 RepID=UPI001CECAAFD
PTLDTTIFRHADPKDLNGYIDQLCQPAEAGGAAPNLPRSGSSTRYRLCTLDADGKLTCLVCPDHQLTTISLAVARHQRLRQLLNQKSYLEAR